MIPPIDTKQMVIIKAQSYFDGGCACSNKHHQIIYRQLLGGVAGMLNELLKQNNQH